MIQFRDSEPFGNQAGYSRNSIFFFFGAKEIWGSTLIIQRPNVEWKNGHLSVDVGFGSAGRFWAEPGLLR